MIPFGYGGIDRIYTDRSIKGDISIESVDFILDIIDDYIELKEAVESTKGEESK